MHSSTAHATLFFHPRDQLPSLYGTSIDGTHHPTPHHLQLIAVPKARIEKLPFWEFFDSRDRFAHISMSSARIPLKSS
jgi:hypothetical protein